MALWDTDDLISRCQQHAGRPATDTEMTPAKWAALLTVAQGHWYPAIATLVPESQYGPLVQLTLSADNKTATFPEGVVPFGKVEVYDGVAGRRLTPGNYNDPGADFSLESDGAGGVVLRGTMDRSLNFPNGLYARYADMGDLEIAPASADGLTPAKQPKLQPPHARILLVYHALALWASQGGTRDPSYFEHLEIKAAHDDPQLGKVGILSQLRAQFQDQGADSGAQYAWWRSPDLGNLRHRMI